MTTRAITERMTSSPALLVALRPHQWTKNLLVFAGLVFSGNLGDVSRWPAAAAVFTAYCLLSSGAYLVNDVGDVEADRKHPTKRLRPIARGDVSPRVALATAAALAVAGLALVAPLGRVSVLLALGFAVGQVAYSRALKRIVAVDALAIAGLFVVRAAAGAAGVGVHISVWLLVCTAFLALFLAFGKRRAELVSLDGEPRRSVLRHYSVRVLGLLVPATAIGAFAAYAAYAVTATDTRMILATLPFVLFGLGRYLYLMARSDLGEEPDRVLLTDAPILLSVVLWALVAAAALNVV
jgi:4-hydroxybenzoate polyprenyltransferase